MEKSKLDLKIARDKLMKNVDTLWDELSSATEVTRTKLSEAYSLQSTSHVNDQNSVIRVSHRKTILEEYSSIDLTLEMRLDRNSKTLVTRIDQQRPRGPGDIQQGQAEKYQIEADPQGNKLYFSKNNTRYTAIDLAEHEVAERLMGINLEI